MTAIEEKDTINLLDRIANFLVTEQVDLSTEYLVTTLYLHRE